MFAIAQQPLLSAKAIAQDAYVPIDNWVYPALDRLRGLGYLDTAFLGLRPWTRRSISAMLAEADQEDGIHDDPQAEEIFLALSSEFPKTATSESISWRSPNFAYESVYTRLQGIAGLPLRDSFHLGQTIANDYGRPYQHGFNTVDGFSGTAQDGRLSLYVRPDLFTTLSNIDLVPIATNPVQATIPEGPIPAANPFRIVEANLSYRLLNHQISIGKSDHWLSPTQGGSFLYSNNAENIYAFQVDRTEPLYVPLLSRLTGPFRYEFFVGSLKGHSDPNDPWYHLEKISFKPTANVEIGFDRATIFKSFFSFQNVPFAEKSSPADPGARFGTFDFSWRLPFLSHWLTLYSDSIVHDDVSPIDAPRHAGVRPGVYLSEVPGIPRLDLRVEGINTDPPTARSQGGIYIYTEFIQVQGYTNKGYIMGDAFGREGKGGQAWLTYHLSPREMIQASYQHKKNAKDLQQEWWKAPVYQSDKQSDTAATFKVTWFPEITTPTRP
jgi:hypothetical protein